MWQNRNHGIKLSDGTSYLYKQILRRRKIIFTQHHVTNYDTREHRVIQATCIKMFSILKEVKRLKKLENSFNNSWILITFEMKFWTKFVSIVVIVAMPSVKKVSSLDILCDHTDYLWFSGFLLWFWLDLLIYVLH